MSSTSFLTQIESPPAAVPQKERVPQGRGEVRNGSLLYFDASSENTQEPIRLRTKKEEQSGVVWSAQLFDIF